MQPYVDRAEAAGLVNRVIVGYGDLNSEVNHIVSKLKPDLVVVGTHGKQGIRQNLFGSAIYKLVRKIPTATLVISDHVKLVEGGYKKVMLPVAPHPDYIEKVKQTCDLVDKDGKICIFAIIKQGVPLDDMILKNIEAAKVEMDARGVKWEYLETESDVYSIGYSKETLENVAKSDMDLISIMTYVSSQNKHFGKMDKENVLLNKQGLAVLCTNYEH
jgi:hypothetical protein